MDAMASASLSRITRATGAMRGRETNCTYVPTEIIEVNVNQHNDLVVKFSRPISPYKDYITNNDLMILFTNHFEEIQQITHQALYFNMPSRYLYLKTKKDFNITGSFFRDDYIEIKYLNTYSIVDINSFEIKKSTYGRVRVHPQVPFKLEDRIEAKTWAR